MSNPISYSPFLGWVDATDPNNLPVDVRIIGASDLLRYENFGVAATTKINAESVRVDDAIVRLDAADAAMTEVDGRINTLESNPVSFFYKSIDTTRTATTTLVEDPHLGFDLGPNQLVEVKAVIFATSPAAADIKFAFAGTGVTLGRWGSSGGGSTATNTVTTALSYGTTGTAINAFVLHGLIEAGAGGGHVGLTWAQFVSDPGNTIVHRYSYLKTQSLSGG